MEIPALLPERFSSYKEAHTGGELAESLIKNPDDALVFYAFACKDETWSSQHPIFHAQMLHWLNRSFYEGRIDRDKIASLIPVIQEHLSVLWEFVYNTAPMTCQFSLRDGEEKLSSLLAGYYSPEVFRLISEAGWRDKNWKISLESVSYQIFHLMRSYIDRGELPLLWREEPDTITTLMELADAWKMPALVLLCSQTLERYITRYTVVPMLIAAQTKNLQDWKLACYSFFNKTTLGIACPMERDAYLRIRLLQYSERSMQVFSELAPCITHLGFASDLIEYPQFFSAIDLCPQLIGLDLGSTFHYHDHLLRTSPTLQHLDLSGCPWLTDETFAPLVQQWTRLTVLNLHSAIHLSFASWGKLVQLHDLENLCLAGCGQIHDEEMILALRSIPAIRELDLHACSGITDSAGREITRLCPKLEKLDLSGCPGITDVTLVELAHYASHVEEIQLVRCGGITTRGVEALLTQSRELRYLNVEGTALDPRWIQEQQEQQKRVALVK